MIEPLNPDPDYQGQVLAFQHDLFEDLHRQLVEGSQSICRKNLKSNESKRYPKTPRMPCTSPKKSTKCRRILSIYRLIKVSHV
jgi:hypothetical protein